MTKTSLCLDDVLENTPQTRCLLKLFEHDAEKLQTYMGRVREALSRLFTAQTEIALSLQQLGMILGDYKEQNFPLDHGQAEFPAVVDKFHRTVIELGSCMDIVGQQLQNCVVYPVDKFIKELDEAANRKELYHTFSDDLCKATEKYAKLHRKEQPKKVEEVSEELCTARKRFHQNGLKYYVQLNNLQYSRRVFLLEPVLSLLYAYRSLFHMGHQALTQQPELTDFFTCTQEQVQSLHAEQQNEEGETKEFLKTIGEIERLQPDIYYVEPLVASNGGEGGGGGNSAAADSKITQKQGYLFMKTKATLMTRWDERYFFTQGGNLMCRGKDDLAGHVLLELTHDVGAGCTENEDRRNTFMVTSVSTKKQLVLQALSQRDRDEWIYVINNLAREGGTGTPSPTATSAKVASSGRTSSPGKKGSREGSSGGSDGAKDETLASQHQEEAVIFTAPIQFDLSLSDDPKEAAESAPSEQQEGAEDQQYKVRFLGCMEVAGDRGERLTHDAMRQILAARLTHNIVLAIEARMVFGGGKLLLLDPDQASRTVKASFQLDDLSYWSTNPDNERLLALIIRTKGGGVDGRHKFNCYVLESIGAESAQEICGSLGAVTKAAFEAMFRKKATTIPDDEAEKQPAAPAEGSSPTPEKTESSGADG